MKRLAAGCGTVFVSSLLRPFDADCSRGFLGPDTRCLVESCLRPIKINVLLDEAYGLQENGSQCEQVQTLTIVWRPGCSALLEALAHELLAFLAFHALRFNVARSHFDLLRRFRKARVGCSCSPAVAQHGIMSERL